MESVGHYKAKLADLLLWDDDDHKEGPENENDEKNIDDAGDELSTASSSSTSESKTASSKKQPPRDGSADGWDVRRIGASFMSMDDRMKEQKN
mmetsp:Transcript_99/g.144  ORF Transcript_99/g.144 Transcript_99/m.144 type:complete len:93 (+) Transcript_99:602-880(+)